MISSLWMSHDSCVNHRLIATSGRVMHEFEYFIHTQYITAPRYCVCVLIVVILVMVASQIPHQ